MYVPFLKLKKNEILSLKDLGVSRLDRIIPFFDIPRISDMSVSNFKSRIDSANKDLSRHWPVGKTFYLDTFDVDQDLRPDGLCPYAYSLGKLSEFNIIPVVGLDRDNEHIQCVENYISENGVGRVAIRLLSSDFDDFELVEEDIEDILGGVITNCESLHLVLDCRVITSSSAEELARNAANFALSFCSNFPCERVIVTGSSISASIADILPTNSSTYIPRLEQTIWDVFSSLFEDENAATAFGDYGVVSPEYSDSDLSPEVMASIMTPKAIYTLNNQHYAVRGSRFRTHRDGYNQYYELAERIVSKAFFRGHGFSKGDKYIEEKSRRIPKAGSPQSWIKNTLNSHMAFIVDSI